MLRRRQNDAKAKRGKLRRIALLLQMVTSRPASNIWLHLLKMLWTGPMARCELAPGDSGPSGRMKHQTRVGCGRRSARRRSGHYQEVRQPAALQHANFELRDARPSGAD